MHLEERNPTKYLFNGIYIKVLNLPPVIVLEKSIINDSCEYI